VDYLDEQQSLQIRYWFFFFYSKNQKFSRLCKKFREQFLKNTKKKEKESPKDIIIIYYFLYSESRKGNAIKLF